MSNNFSLYLPPQLIDNIKEYLGNEANDYNYQHMCVYSVTNSNNALVTAYYLQKNDNTNNYVTFNVTYSQNMVLQTGTISKNTSQPRNCYNKAQLGEYFQYTNTKYDYFTYTSSYFYHPQFDSILIIFFIITLVCIYFPYKVFSRAFGRWLKV